MESFFVYSSAMAFLTASILIIFALVFLVKLVRGIVPMLDEAHSNVHELGELANSTVAHVSDTIDIVETRVTTAMTQVNVGGQEVRSRGMGIASAVAGAYVAVRMVVTIRSLLRSSSEGTKNDRKRTGLFGRKIKGKSRGNQSVGLRWLGNLAGNLPGQRKRK